jgi:DNA invertase Pin-like site-specific DNA recombinase
MKQQLAYPYYRVSTKRQGKHGLGLAAQRRAVEDFARSKKLCIGKAYLEIESGKNNRRPVLERALMSCKCNGGMLLIAKLDRLSRNATFIGTVIESGIPVKAVDYPNADKFILQILAAVSELEGDMISKRMSEGLQVVKSRGKALGSYAVTLAQRRREASAAFAARMLLPFYKLRLEGFRTCRAMADELNRRGRATFQKGARWHAQTVSRIIRQHAQVRTGRQRDCARARSHRRDLSIRSHGTNHETSGTRPGQIQDQIRYARLWRDQVRL